MKIAVFSDIHGNKEALEAVISSIKKKKVDRTICLGDTIAIGPDSNDCLNIIRKNKIRMTIGNHEKYFLKGIPYSETDRPEEYNHQKWVKTTISAKNKKYLENCPYGIKLTEAGKEFLFIHYKMEYDRFKNEVRKPNDPSKTKEFENKIKELFRESQFAIFGHDHHEYQVDKENSFYLNVGSSGCTEDDNTHYYILNINDKDISSERINEKYNRNKFLERMKQIDYPAKEFIKKTFYGIGKSIIKNK